MKKTYLVNALRVDIQRDMWGYIDSHADNCCYNDEFDADELDEIEEDLDAIEDYILDDEDDYDFSDDDDELDWDDDEDELDGEDPEEGFDFGDENSTIYEVECACGEIIDFDEEVLEKGSIVCPNCGETLEFSLEDEE